jgi:23S rRNA pseudouridine1911/1915/1917 synthase
MVSVGSRDADYREPTPTSPGGAPPDVTVRPEPADSTEPDIETDSEAEVRHLKLPPTLHGERLDKVLVTIAPEFSRGHLQHLIEAGHVQVDGQTSSTSSRRLKSGQRVALELVPTEESRAFRPEAMALDILFEDEHLLVLNKPVGLVVHPAVGNWSGTLLNGLLHHHPAAAALPRAGIVHRLDKDTSGVMMVGKSLPAVTALLRDIAARDVQRRYVALVHGLPKAPTFTVDAPIARDPRVRLRMAVVAGGRPSRTDVACVGSITGPSSVNAVTAVRCTLHTGRTHQIRVHLAHIGHPLVADAVYGGRQQLGLQRQALHAVSLALRHPVSQAALHFDCPLPADLLTAWLQVTGTEPA